MKTRFFWTFTVFLIVLMGIGFIRFKQSGNSWSEFRERKIAKVLNLLPVLSNKFWAHRCDSVEKVQLTSKIYSGIEIDAYFYKDDFADFKFEISHDMPEEMKHPLEDLLPLIAEAKDTKIWFDCKNLHKENAEKFLKTFEDFIDKYNIDKKRFIVESFNYEALKPFHDKGYYTSFYLVFDYDIAYGQDIVYNKDIIFDDPKWLEYFFNSFNKAVSTGNFDAVSFPCTYYKLVKKTGTSLDLLTWHTHGENWLDFYLKDNLRQILDDDQVKVILVNVFTKYDR